MKPPQWLQARTASDMSVMTAAGGGGGCYAGDYEPSSPLMLPLTDCCGGSGSPAWSQWQ